MDGPTIEHPNKAAAVLVLLLVVLMTVASCSTASPRASVLQSTSAPIPRQTAQPVNGGGLAPPTSGILVGAAVQPDQYTQQGWIAAFQRFQTQMGRRLDIAHVYHTWDVPFPTLSDRELVRQGAILMISWAGTDTRSIASGQYDEMIRERADAVKTLVAPILMQFRWEMDRPNLQSSIHSPADYIAAWVRIRRLFAQEGVTNVAWVWCPTAAGFALGRAQAYYPGDDQVDWVCATAYPPAGSYQPLAELLAAAAGWASQHGKPFMIGEFAALGDGTGRQATWISDAARWLKQQPNIKAAVYFDYDPVDSKSGQPIHYSLDRSQSVEVFRSILRDPYFNPQHFANG